MAHGLVWRNTTELTPQSAHAQSSTLLNGHAPRSCCTYSPLVTHVYQNLHRRPRFMRTTALGGKITSCMGATAHRGTARSVRRFASRCWRALTKSRRHSQQRRPKLAVSSTWDTKRLFTSKRTTVDEFDSAVAATTDNVLNPRACEHCKLNERRSRSDMSCLAQPAPSEPGVAVCWLRVMAFRRTTRSAWSSMREVPASDEHGTIQSVQIWSEIREVAIRKASEI